MIVVVVLYGTEKVAPLWLWRPPSQNRRLPGGSKTASYLLYGEADLGSTNHQKRQVNINRPIDRPTENRPPYARTSLVDDGAGGLLPVLLPLSCRMASITAPGAVDVW